MSAITSTVNAVAALAFAGYIGAVAWQGNMTPALDAAKQDGIGYLEFLIAAALLKVAVDNKQLRPYVLPLVIIAGVAVAIKTISGNTSLIDRVHSFGQGKTGLFGLFNLPSTADTSKGGTTTIGETNG